MGEDFEFRMNGIPAMFLVFALLFSISSAQAKELRMLFTGDILLSRNVIQEITWKQESPWLPFHDLFAQADWVVGNLEGAVGSPDQCAQPPSPLCFALPETSLALLREAGFDALSLANNHSADLGLDGRLTTWQRLAQNGITPLTYDNSPGFVTFGDITIGVVALALIPGVDGQAVTLPNASARQKLRLARQLAHLVVVLVHWGNELQDWQSSDQEAQARWLVEHGADVIIGHHPHVIQTPACVRGKPVFYSVGNHLFDQKYELTKQGLIAECRVSTGVLTCGALLTQTPDGSAYPMLQGRAAAVDAELSACRVPLAPPAIVAGYRIRPIWEISDGHQSAAITLQGFRAETLMWQTAPAELLSIESGRLEQELEDEFLLTLERHYSPIDDEQGVRPYVYQVTERGLLARWRGSALAWPLIDAALLPNHVGVLCALHRGDSFLMPQPDRQDTRIMAYHWNGFGFSGLADSELLMQCQRMFEHDTR